MSKSLIFLTGNIFKAARLLDLASNTSFCAGTMSEHPSVEFTPKVLKALIENGKNPFIFEAANKDDIALAQKLELVDASDGILDNWFTLPQFVVERKYYVAYASDEGKTKYTAMDFKQLRTAIKDGVKLKVSGLSAHQATRLKLNAVEAGNFVYFTTGKGSKPKVEEPAPVVEPPPVQEPAPVVQPVPPRKVGASISSLKKKTIGGRK